MRSYACLTPHGWGADSLWEACLAGNDQFENGLAKIPTQWTQEAKNKIHNFAKDPFFEGANESKLLIWSLAVIQEALEKAGWENLDDCGLVISTTTGLTSLWEQELMNHFRKAPVSGQVYHPLGSFAVELKHQLDHSGPIQVVSSACCAGTQAVEVGRSWILSGRVDRCVVLGAEQICQLTERGFRSLSLVNGEKSRPFNESFNNICLSEAVAVLCLQKGVQSCAAFVSGVGCASDGFSMTAPRPDGSGPRASIRSALKEARLSPADIDWVHAHGTGSLQNDRAEAAAISKMEIHAPVTSTKGVHGHSLAAAGVLETLICLQAIERSSTLPTWGGEPKHFTINVNMDADEKPLQHVLKNTLGFGGINSSLMLSRVN